MTSAHREVETIKQLWVVDQWSISLICMKPWVESLEPQKKKKESTLKQKF
jgi:hypothetical protein